MNFETKGARTSGRNRNFLGKRRLERLQDLNTNAKLQLFQEQKRKMKTDLLTKYCLTNKKSTTERYAKYKTKLRELITKYIRLNMS